VRAPLADGVVEQDGEVVLARDARPALDASLGLRAAAAAAQAGLRLAPHTVERLAAEGADLPIPWPRDAREALVSLLGAGAATVPVWEALDLSGLVSRWIPEWSAVRYRQQHNPIHRFTVDRHLVEAAAHASTLTRRVARPDLLLVGALLHDIGKGFPGDHTEAGMVVVADLAPRIGFDAADTATLVAMIRLHLLLPETATRRDLDDPATLSAVAAEVGTRELLDLLHALAQADALATGPAAWTEWRAALIDDLAERTRQTLAGDPAPPPPALDGADLPEPGPDGLAVAWTATSYGHRLLVSAPDRVGLLADVAGVLSLQRLAVRSARVASVGGRAVQEWVVTPEFGDPPAVDRVRVDLRRTLDGTLDLGGRLAARAADYAPGRGVVIAPPRVELVPGASSAATVMEVRAHDRPGLLRTVAAALAAEAVDVSAAVVATLGSDAVDVFYLAQDGGPLDAATAERARVAVLGSLA
jgi:[protein-PII] uridylyltransferase